MPNTQQMTHLLAQQQQQQFQHPPSSPRVHALNGAFHYLSTSTMPPQSPSQISPPVQMQSQQQQRSSPVEFKSEPSIEIDDMPTDLSTGGERKYSSSGSANVDCYP